MKQFHAKCSQHGCDNLVTALDDKEPTHCPTCNNPLQAGDVSPFIDPVGNTVAGGTTTIDNAETAKDSGPVADASAAAQDGAGAA